MRRSALAPIASRFNWHGKTQEIAYVLKDCGAKAVVAHVDLLPEVMPAIPPHVPLFVVPTPPEIAAAYGIARALCTPPTDALQWEDLITCFPPQPEAAAGVISSMIYTSGTTGNPKGVRRLDLGPEAARLFAEGVRDVFGIAPDRVVRTVITGPLYHAAPNAYGLYAVRMGGLTVLQPRFDAEELLRLIEQYRITHLHMVPTMSVRLLRLPEEVRQKYDLASLEWVIHGAAPCPVAVKRAMIEWWGPVIYEYYGATETGSPHSMPPRKHCASPAQSGDRGPAVRCASTMPTVGSCRRARSARSISGSTAFPISPTTARTTSAARSGVTA